MFSKMKLVIKSIFCLFILNLKLEFCFRMSV